MLLRPFETASITGGFNFSHGHLIKNAGYDAEFNNVFIWEEPYQGYLAWKAGYTLYAPMRQDIWHLWDRSYRPIFGNEKK